MKLRIVLLVFITYGLLLTQLIAQNNAPVVSNSRFEQRTDGSFKVDIYYDVNDADGDAMTISILVSDDGGVTWGFTATNLIGDIGAGITNGTNKQIVWDFGTEHPETFSDKFIIEISADDGQGDGFGIPCPGIPTVTYGEQTYSTVLIGEQCWFKENLNIGTKINSATEGFQQTDNSIIEKYCYYNDEANCNIYGGLYEWPETMQYLTTEGTQGICPDGWHIPTYVEMQTLTTIVAGDGNALKAIGQGNGDGIGTNTSGFSILLAGFRDYTTGSSSSLGGYGYLWSSSEYNGYAYAMGIYNIYSDVTFYNHQKGHGFSVRCLKD